MKKLTVQKAKDELTGSLMLGIGIIGGTVVIKLANKFIPVAAQLNGFTSSAVPIVGGGALRLMTDNGYLKDIGNGLMGAGAADATVKGLTLLGEKVPAIKSFTEGNLPTLSGFKGMKAPGISTMMQQRPPEPKLRGLKNIPAGLNLR